MRSSVTNAIQHVRTFTTEVTEASKKLATVIDSIEGKYITMNKLLFGQTDRQTDRQKQTGSEVGRQTDYK